MGTPSVSPAPPPQTKTESCQAEHHLEGVGDRGLDHGAVIVQGRQRALVFQPGRFGISQVR